jgi:transposase
MGAAYSQDLRDRVLAAYDRGMGTRSVAELFRVSDSWARRVNQRRRDNGERSARPMGGARAVKIDMEKLPELAARQPDAATRELHERRNAPCGEPAVGMALSRLGFSFKKRRSMRPSRTGRMSRPGVTNGV